MANSVIAEHSEVRDEPLFRGSDSVFQSADYQVGSNALRAVNARTEAAEVGLPSLTITGLDTRSLAANRVELLAAARESLTPDQLATLNADMTRFEQRLNGDPQEVANTYRQVGRILNSSANLVAAGNARAQIALDVIRQAADPRSVQQSLQTCTVASLESRIYARHPAAAAELVADVTTDGSYRGQEIDHDSIAFYEFPQAMPDNERVRSFGSQIFQITAANVFQQLEAGAHGADVEFILTPPAPGEYRREQLVNKETGAVVASNPGITLNDAEGLRRLNNFIVGADEPPFVITLAQNPTEQDFLATLQTLRQEENLPALLAIRADSKLINGSVGPVPYHLLVLEPGADSSRVFINNQFNGPAGDFETSITSAFNAMRLNDDLVNNESWRNSESNAFRTVITMAENGQLSSDILRNVQNTLLEFKPEHIRAVEANFQAKFSEDLPSLLSDVLDISDGQMKLLGYEHGLLSGWRHTP